MSNVILRLPTVKARIGLSRSTIYLRVAEGSFPRPVSLGGRAVGWVESEVDAWISRQIEAGRKKLLLGSAAGTLPSNAVRARS